MKRRICVVTGSRAEYGLLYWLMKGIQEEDELELQLIVTNMHLSPEFGLTYKEIEKDGFFINKKLKNLFSDDSEVGITKSSGQALINYADAFKELKPDIILLLGDRYEIFAAASAAMIARIPIAHLHGGESTEGAFDEAFRHSITKMSHLHFTATEQYKKRVIQLGENPERVFNVGAIGIENIQRLELLNKNDFEKSIDFKLNKRNLLITYHPVTLEKDTSAEQFSNLLFALDELENTNLIFTKPNSDTGGRVIIKMINDYVKNNSHKSLSFISMGQVRYLSALQFVDAVVGNSSSGIVEVPYFKIGTINIGDRQKGRIKAKSIIDCMPKKNQIKEAFEKLYSKEFQNGLQTVENKFGDGKTSKKIIEILLKYNLESILKKKFYDIEFNV